LSGKPPCCTCQEPRGHNTSLTTCLRFCKPWMVGPFPLTVFLHFCKPRMASTISTRPSFCSGVQDRGKRSMATKYRVSYTVSCSDGAVAQKCVFVFACVCACPFTCACVVFVCECVSKHADVCMCVGVHVCMHLQGEALLAVTDHRGTRYTLTVANSTSSCVTKPSFFLTVFVNGMPLKCMSPVIRASLRPPSTCNKVLLPAPG